MIMVGVPTAAALDENCPGRIRAPLAHERFEVHHQAEAAALVWHERLTVEGLVEVKDEAVGTTVTKITGSIKDLAADDRRFPPQGPAEGGAELGRELAPDGLDNNG
jgi:hypothetical protein